MTERAGSAEELRGQHLHLDCASGAAGDMTLGALIDLGVPEEVIRRVLDDLGVGGHRLHATRVRKRGVSAVDVKVDDSVDDTPDGGSAHGGHHEHTHYRDIKAQILGADLPAAVVERAMDMFERVARAEAKLHGTTVDEVAFHEVGAIDSIVDIVGAAAALAWLDPASVTCASVAVGHGQVRCAHGILPVPAPATLEILREAGGVMHSGGVARELCTPTGAAILASAVTAWAPAPAMVPVAAGYGAGDADLDDRANVMRATVGRREQGAGDAAPGSDSVWSIEANIDDMSPELCEHAARRAFEAGAVDVWWAPIVMKKGRPALALAALAPEEARRAVEETILRETTTLGVRSHRLARRVLERGVEHVDTAYGRLPVKVARLGDRVVNAAPEYEPCLRAARAQGAPLKEVFAAAAAAYWHGRRASR